jgi:pyruvate dehydrogenase E2 component (dihydrolipoamide acetyltransferase)
MAEVIEMPRLSDTMTEGVIVKWHKKVGDPVKAGDLLAEIETDKATMEFESPIGASFSILALPKTNLSPSAFLLLLLESLTKIFPRSFQKGTLLLLLLVRGSAEPALAASGPAASPMPAPTPVEAASPSEARLKASPLARKMAKEAGIDLRQLQGTGEGGRIIRRDVEAYLSRTAEIKAPSLPTPPSTAPYQEVPLSQMRKTIARRLTASMQEAPHFYLTRSISMEAAATWREKLNALSPTKISFNDLIIKAVAMALRKHPYLNAAWMGDHIRLYQEIHIGFAVAVEEGLIVPVIRHADRKGLSEIATETATLAQKARERKLSPEEYTGSTFSISNLGMFGIEEFTAVINPPEAAILAVGAIQPTPVVKGDKIEIERRMRVTLSCDHRVVDGATGAAFLATLTELLEEPARLLL